MRRSDFAGGEKPSLVPIGIMEDMAKAGVKLPDGVKLEFTGRFRWKNQFNESECVLIVFSYLKKLITVACEVPNNPGLSVTNGAENLWKKVKEEWGDTICAETYDGQNYDIVTFKNGKPSWEHMGALEFVLQYKGNEDGSN